MGLLQQVGGGRSTSYYVKLHCSFSSRSVTLVDGGRAALEHELLWLVALGNADAPRAIELQRMLSAQRPGSLRLVGQIGDETGGADDATPSSDR